MAANRWEEYKEKKAAEQSSGQQAEGQKSETKKKNRYEEYKEKKGERQSHWDSSGVGAEIATSIYDGVNIWLQNHNNYLSNYNSRYKDRKYSYEDAYVSDSAQWLDTVSKQKSAFDTEADRILAYMEQNAGYLDEGFMQNVRDILAEARGAQGQILDAATKDNEWWSNFADEATYQTSQRYDGYSKKYTGATSEDIQKALDTIGVSEERDWLKYYRGDIAGETARSDADFQKYASQGATLDYTEFGTEEWHKGKSRRQRGYNSIDKYRAASLALAEHYGNDAPLGSQGQYEEQVSIYRTMKDEEFENLAYYIAYDKEHGTNMAEEYVDIMEEILSQRRGTEIGEKVTGIDIPVIEGFAALGYGVIAGVNNFAFGVEQRLSDEELAYYPSHYANAHIGEQASGLDSYLHSAATNVGNMAPSILVSAAFSGLGAPSKVSEAVGSATMGFSASGNAYKEALSKGYDKETARLYGDLVGASEGTLQYLIGGISKLGGVSGKVANKIAAIDKAFLRGAAKLGVKLVGEITEEEIQNYLEPAFRTILFGEDYDAPKIEEIIETAIVTMLSTGALEADGTVKETRAETALNKQYIQQYGAVTDELIKEGLLSDPKSESYKLAQEYQQQTKGEEGKDGKPLTGYQIRSLVEANEAQFAAEDFKEVRNQAKERLKELGENMTEVWPLAELIAKRATGQTLTRAEKSKLVKSQFGAQVAKEMSDAAEATEVAETSEKPFNVAYKTVNTEYKPLTERAGEEGRFAVAESGEAAVRESGEKVDLENFQVTKLEDGQLTIKPEGGEEVYAGDIDFATSEQSHAFSGVADMEGMTAPAATEMIKAIDLTKPVGAQLNGLDEAFTYGRSGYSVEDLKKKGKFVGDLTDEQMTLAYELGKAAKTLKNTNKTEAISKMRTAVEAAKKKAAAEGKKAPKGRKMTITYNHGGGVIEDIKTAEKKLGKLTEEQSGGIEAAKILNKMGIGTDYELFTSYYSKTLKDKDGNPLEVFLDDNGQEQPAYAGIYMSADGKIRINLNAYKGTRGLTLNALAHELTHFIEDWSLEKYNVMVDYLMKAYGEKGVSMHDLVLKEQARLKKVRGKDVSYNEAYHEVVANAFNRMLEDGKVMDRIAEIRKVDKSLGDKIIEAIRKFIKRFMKVYQENQSLFHETQALMEMKEVFEQLQGMFAEALVDASENFQANLMAQELGVEPVAVEKVTQYSYSSLAEAAGFAAVENEDGTRSFVRDGKKVSEVTVEDIENSPIGAFINYSLEMKDISKADADRQKKMFADICTMACKTNDFAMTMQFVGSAVFTGMKANADKQYGTTYDFPSICTKTQAVIDAMSAKMMSLRRGLTSNEIVQLYADVFASGNPVPCPECYVFSRWIGIGGLLDNIKKYQDYYGDMAVKDVADAYLKMKAEVSKFAEEQGISFGKAKGALTAKLTKEYNKLTEKIEKAENQGEKVKAADRQRLAELEPMMNTVKSMTWLENVYFADSSLKKVNPNFRVPNDVLFDLNNGETFASKYKEAWAFRTTQGAGYGKAITPYAEARLGEGVLVTNNTTKAIKDRANGTLNNYFLNQNGKLDKQSREALKRARLKQKIQAFIGGQRFQSTSDARYENASDYLLAALEMQAMHGMVQCYTKVDGAVPAFSAWGFSINQSLMPLNGGLDANGNVHDTSVGGMKPSVAFENRQKHESAGTITIGVNDNHIRAMFKQLVRDFIIPYHASGGKADVVAEFRRIQEGKEAKGKAVRSTDYSRTQSDKVLSDEVLRWQGKTEAQIQRIHEIRDARIAILTGGNVNMTVVRSNRFLSALYDKLNGGEWDGVKLAKSKVESQIFPNEFWDQTVTYEESAKITKDYLEYCEDLGFLHRFSGMIPSNGKLVPASGYDQNGNRVQLTDLAYKYDEKGNKTAEVEEFFWKVLTDRRMYDNNGNYLPQKIVTLNDTAAETVTGFAKNNQGRQYDKAKAEALAKKIVDNSTAVNENKLTDKNDRGESSDNRGIRKGTSQTSGVPGTDGRRYSENSGASQEAKSWDRQSGLVKSRIVGIVDKHIKAAKSREEVFALVSRIANISKAELATERRMNAIQKVAEKIYSDAMTLHPLLFDDKWRLLGKVNDLRSEIIAATKDSDTSRKDIDSDGNQLSNGQQDFFKDTKVVDKNGKLLVMYHGSSSRTMFTVFERRPLINGKNYGEGYYFTEVKNEAYGWGSSFVHTVYVNLNNPYYASTEMEAPEAIVALVKKQLGATYDKLSQDPKWWGSELTREEFIEKNSNRWSNAEIALNFAVDESDISDDGFSEEVARRKTELLKSLKYDGVIVTTSKLNRNFQEVVAFDSNQIKFITNKNPTKNIDMRYSSQETDLDYMDAVKRGDMETAQRMVDKAAKKAGYTVKGYHGSRTPGFTVVDKYSWLWFARDEAVANGYGTHNDAGGNGKPHNKNGVYAMRYNLGNNLEVYADGASWGELPVTEDEYPGVYADEETGFITTNAMAEWAERNGYDSITFVDVDDGGLTTVDVIFNPNRDAKSADPVTYADDGGVIPLSERFNPKNDDLRYSSQETDNITNRDLLANAFEGITQNSEEYKLIQEYKGRIKLINEYEEKLSKVNEQIREITFGKGKRDNKKLQKLQAEAKELAGHITRNDRKLLNLEASAPLRKVIEQERKKASQKTREHVNEILQNKKVRAEQTELRHKIRKAIRDLDKILNRGNKQRNVKEDLQPVVTKALQAAEILFTDNYGDYDMLRNGIGTDLSDAEEALVNTCARMLKDLDKIPADGYDNFQARQEAENRLKTKMSGLKEVFARERKRLNGTKVSSILNDLAEAYASLEKSDQSYVQGAYNEAVYNFLKNLQSEVGGTIVRDMTKNQLESLYAAYKMVLTTVRKANQMFNEELKQSREQLGNAVIQEVITAGGTHGLWTKGEIARSQADWNNTKPVWVANRIGSETFGKLMKGLFKGQYNFAVDIDEAKRFKLEMDNKYKPRKWDTEKQYNFRTPTGKEFSLSLQQIMSLYAYSKREQAYSHLLNGGFVFESNSTVIVDQKGIKRTYLHDGATAYKLNEATLNEILRSLTADQKAYVDEMQKYLSETMGDKGNEVSMQLYGIKMFNEQFYFPLRSSGAYLERAKEAELKKQQGQINIVNSGFTHAVKPEAKNPVILAGFADVWAEHCNEMSMYHSMVLPMEDFRKVYNYSTIHDDKLDSASVFQTIQDAYGKAATGYIDQLYRELNAGATIDPRETPFKARISKFKKAAVMLSASVVVQQFSAIGRAYAVIDPRYFTGSKVNSGTNLSAVEEMKKYAPVAIIKEMGGFDTGTKGSAKSYILAEQYGKGERLQGLLKDEQYRGDIMGYLPAKADEKTWCAIWEAAKRETRVKNPKMDVKSEEFLKLAGERFSEIIEKTQVYDSVLARSANMRSKSAFMAMATAFMAEPTTTINLLEDAIRGKNKKYMARAFGAVAVSIVLNNALASIVYAMRDDDEDETFIEKYFQSFVSGMIDDINPMSYYPFLKDVYSLFQGYDVERADMSVIADVRDALKKSMSVIGKDTSNMDDQELAEHYKNVTSVLMSLLDAGCSMFGVPVKNVRRDANGIINAWNTIKKDVTERDTTWDSFWDKVGAAAKDTIPVYAWTKDRAKGDKLYDAIISGDTAYLDRLKGAYKTEDAYASAVRKALRENDPRIRQAAQAKYDGNVEEYKRIFRQIQGEKKFSFDEIMDAVNTELSNIKKGLNPAKESSNYSATDFVNAVIVGEASSAAAIREDILAYKVAGGDTMEEAEKSFASSVATSTRNAFDSGLLDETGAERMLVDYAGKDEEEAAEKVSYWAFCKAHPEYDLSESNVEKYHEFAEPEGIPLDVFAQYINGTKGLATIIDKWGDVEKSVRDQTLEVIDSLPLTWQQKDALYLAAGYAESKIWDVPW